MLGVILPILGLVILPLVTSFMTGGGGEEGGMTPTQLAIYISVIYNIAIPLTVYYFGKTILATRPTGYGETNLGVKGKKNDSAITLNLGGGAKIELSPFWLAFLVCAIGVFLTFIPLLMNAATSTDIVTLNGKVTTMDYSSEEYGMTTFQFLGYKQAGNTENWIGPYGLGAAIFSLFLPLALGLSLGIYFKLKSSKLMKTRENSKKLENEFASSLFQLGNRLGDGFPAEIAFTKVADVMKGSVTGNFFSTVSTNIQTMGLSVRDAIFDPKIGALVYYPSNLIESSMKVLVESARKGPIIAAQALLNISRYVKEIHRVNERLQDLMAEIISSMKSQISFMLPVISGIVVGITSMVTYILSRLKAQMAGVLETGAEGQMQGMSGILNMFGDGVPTYYTQMIIGVYVIEITLLLTIIMNNVENGSDKLNEQHMLGQNLIKTTLLYVFLSLAVMIIFNMIAGTIISGMMAKT
jgi:hypothetical protein